jgi:hypothetical protein
MNWVLILYRIIVENASSRPICRRGNSRKRERKETDKIATVMGTPKLTIDLRIKLSDEIMEISIPFPKKEVKKSKSTISNEYLK